MCIWFVPKVSVLIFLRTNWQSSTSLMYIGTLVDVYRYIGSDLGCMSILVSTGLVEPVVCYCCLCMVMFSNLVMFAMQENIEQRYAIKFRVKLNISATETFASLPKLMELPLYRELWFLSGTKLSKRAEKILKTTLVLEDQSRQQMIKMCKWCKL